MQLFDLYEGSPDQSRVTSLWHILSYSVQKTSTLEDADVSAAMDRILKGLEALGIELRK